MNPYEARLRQAATNEGYEVLSPYINSQTKVRLRHAAGTCSGHIFDMTPNKFLQGRRCPRCAGVERYTDASYRAYIEEKTGGNWTTVGGYVSTDIEMRFACGRCGAEHLARPRIFISRRDGHTLACQCGNPLPARSVFLDASRAASKARGGRRKTTEQVQSEIDRIFGPDQYVLQEVYAGSMRPVDVLHTACGRVSRKRVDAMIHHGEGCIYCSGRARVRYEDAAQAIAASGTHILLSEELPNTKTPVDLLHTASGSVYRVSYKDFVHKGHRGHHASGPEEEIVAYVTSLGFTVRRRDRTVLAPLEVDILVEGTDLGIEYNGSYYHSDRFRLPSYHQEKADAAERAGIRLLQVKDSDWAHRRAIVESKLAHALGKTQRRVSARSLTLRHVNPASAAAFFRETHLQGAPRGAFDAYALVDGQDTILACLALGMGGALGYRGTAGEREVIRYATALQTAVRGGYTRLTKYIFQELPDVERLVTFADRMWGSGALYRATGWSETGRVAPRYSYVHAPSAREYHRTSFTKDKIAKKFPEIFNPALTERQMMDKTNFVRVYDAGKIRFALSR